MSDLMLVIIVGIFYAIYMISDNIEKNKPYPPGTDYDRVFRAMQVLPRNIVEDRARKGYYVKKDDENKK
jgi:hypothetical protein|nr:MAG TPA: hypothetical protein [Caudoviricetes sp.]